MDTDEAGGVDLRLDVGEGLLLEVALAFHVECDVAVLGLDGVDRPGGQDVDSRSIQDRDASERSAGLACRGGQRPGRDRGRALSESSTCAIERLGEPLRADGLEEIVHGAEREGAQRGLIVGHPARPRGGRTPLLRSEMGPYFGGLGARPITTGARDSGSEFSCRAAGQARPEVDRPRPANPAPRPGRWRRRGSR